MRCPFCSAEKNHLNVIDSRSCDGGRSIRRRRECEVCHKRFTTYERIEETTRLLVVKKNGERKPFDREKIMAGLERACYKRPIPESELQRIADEVEEEIKGTYDREVLTSAIGQLVTEKLRRVDQVAYVRYASVYREFKTLEDLVEEAKAVLDARRYEDEPGQGRLFIEPPAALPAAVKANGEGEHAAPAPRKPRGRPAAVAAADAGRPDRERQRPDCSTAGVSPHGSRFEPGFAHGGVPAPPARRPPMPRRFVPLPAEDFR